MAGGNQPIDRGFAGALEVKVDSGGTVHLILDVTGYFE